jgi:hypothetical protein
MELKEHIASFTKVMTHKECQILIDHYNTLSNLNLSFTRIDLRDAPNHKKSDTAVFVLEESSVRITPDMGFLNFFLDRLWKCYEEYTTKYSILEQANKHQVRSMKIQKTLPGEGYHVWHFESDTLEHSSRLITWGLYLNTVEEGGETEFLYQGLRVSAVEGTLVMWPATYTHVHRGNPPLSGEKYLLTGWIEY